MASGLETAATILTGGIANKNFRKKGSELLFGKKGKNKQLSLQTPEQQELTRLIIDGLKGGGEGPLKELFGAFNPAEFDKGVTQPALKNFKENILPSLQEKFIAGNQVGGSGMQNAQNKAGVDLQSKLAELMYGAQQGQKQNQLQGVNSALGVKPFENVYKPATQGVLQGFAQGAGNAAGKYIAG